MRKKLKIIIKIDIIIIKIDIITRSILAIPVGVVLCPQWIAMLVLGDSLLFIFSFHRISVVGQWSLFSHRMCENQQ